MNETVVPYTDEEIRALERNMRAKAHYGLLVSCSTEYHKRIPSNVIERWAKDGDRNFRITAMKSCKYTDAPLPDVITCGLRDDDYSVYQAALDTCLFRDDISLAVIEKWASDPAASVRKAALSACVNVFHPAESKGPFPVEVFDRGLHDPDWAVCLHATIELVDYVPSDIPTEYLDKWAQDKNGTIREMAIDLCVRDVNFETAEKTPLHWDLIDRGMDDPDDFVRNRALSVCVKGKNVPLTFIKKWADAKDPRVRALSMKACAGRTDVPWEVIEKGLQDSNKSVRGAAKAACLGKKH